MKFFCFLILFTIAFGQYQASSRRSPSSYPEPIYRDPYDSYYQPLPPRRPQPNPQRPPISPADKGLSQIFSVIFSCVAMICVMFNKRPIIKQIIKTRSSQFINEVSLLSESAREVGIISLGVLNGGDFHSYGEVTVGLVLNMFILALSLYYCNSKFRKQTLSASLIGVSMFSYSFISKSLNHKMVQAMPYIGSAILISFRFSNIPKLIRTREIVGTTTYRTLYLGALSMLCRILSFLTVGQMHTGRWVFIGLPFLSILVMIFVHWKYNVREPERKRKYEEESSKEISQISFSRKSK